MLAVSLTSMETGSTEWPSSRNSSATASSRGALRGSDDDPGALLCHGARHGFADAGAAARNQRYPSRKIHSLFTFSPPEEREAGTGPIPKQGPTR